MAGLGSLALKIVATTLGALVTFALLFPVLYIVLQSLLTNDRVLIIRLTDVAKYGLSVATYYKVLTDPQFLGALANSSLVAALTIVISLLVIAPAAYGFSRFKFYGRDSLLYTYLVLSQAGGGFGIIATIALYLFLLKLSAAGIPVLGNAFVLPLVYSSWQVPFLTWLVKTYFDALPRELDEAAFMDGASWMTILFRVVLPASKASLITISLFSFMSAWGEFILASLLRVNTLAQYIYVTAFGAAGLEAPGRFAASAILFALPVIFVYVFMQRYIGEAMRIGGLRG
ncbi:MAG: ABC transporter permease subunit [Desulfurococcaceae archaeon]